MSHCVDESRQSRKLFGAPLEEKQGCSIQTNNRGWAAMHAESLDPKNQKVILTYIPSNVH